MRYSNDPSGFKRSLAAARAEIERMTKERDEARAQVDAVVVGLKSLVSVVQGYQQMPGFSLHPMVAAQIDSLAQTSISDYKSALEAYGREKMREGMRLAAGLIAKLRDDYISEYGIYDPTTGVTEFPGNGDEYVSELDDCEAAILADMEKLK